MYLFVASNTTRDFPQKKKKTLLEINIDCYRFGFVILSIPFE